MSALFEKLCASSSLNLPNNMRSASVDDFAETQGNNDPLTAFITQVASTTVNTSTSYVSPFRYHPDGWILPSPAAAARIKLRNSLDEDSCLSFDEWKACGFFVKKGSKSHFQDCMGIPQFTKEQVEKSKWRR